MKQYTQKQFETQTAKFISRLCQHFFQCIANRRGLMTAAVMLTLFLLINKAYAAEDVPGLVDRFVKAYNTLDIDAMRSICTGDALLQFENVVKMSNNGGKKPLMEVTLGDAIPLPAQLAFSAKVSLTIGSHAQLTHEPMVFYFSHTKDGVRIEKIDQPRISKRNIELMALQDKARALSVACRAKDRKAIVQLLGLHGETADAVAAGNAIIMDKIGLHWLHRVLSEPSLSIGDMSASWEGGIPTATLEIKDKHGEVVDKGVVQLAADVHEGKAPTYHLVPVPSPSNTLPGQEIGNLWDAVFSADEVGLIQVRAGSTPKLIRVASGVQSLKALIVPSRAKGLLTLPGDYIVPLVAASDGYHVLAGGYPFPKVKEEDAPAFLATVQGIKQAESGSARQELLRAALYKMTNQTAAAEAARYLTRNRAPNKGALSIWISDMKDVRIDPKARMVMAEAVADNDYSLAKNVISTALQVAETRTDAARIMQLHDPEGLKAILLSWLNEPAMRKDALHLALRYRNDEEFFRPATQSFDAAKPDELILLMPYLLSPKNEEGQARVEKLIGESANARTAAIVLSQLARSKDGRFTNAVNNAFIRLWASQERRDKLVALEALQYLLRVKSPEGIKAAQRVAGAIGNDVNLQRQFLMVMGSVAGKPFSTLEACQQWLATQ